MNSTDPEMAEMKGWAAAWQATPPEPEVAALRRRVERRGRWLVLETVGEALISCGALGLLARAALVEPAAWNVATLGGLALLIVWIWVFALWNRRGLWRPESATFAAHLELSLRRAHRRLRGLLAGWWLLAGEVLLLVPWLWRVNQSRGLPSATADFLWSGFALAGLCGFAGAALVLLRRRTRREIEELEDLRRSFAAEIDSP
jgi:hypothetical protein